MKTKTSIVLFVLIITLFLISHNIYEKATYAFNVGSKDRPIETKSGFLNYNNLTYGISIAYPSNWTNPGSGNTTELQSRVLVDYPVITVARDTLFSNNPTSVMVIIYHLHSPNILLRDFYTNIVADIANYEKNFALIELSTTVTLAHNPAYKLVLTHENVENGVKTGESKEMLIFTIIGENAYVINYESDLSKYSRYLPIVQKMIDSFEVIR